MLFPQDYFARGNSISLPAFLANQRSTVYSNAPAGMLFYGDPGIPKAFTNDKLRNFSPRLGLVWNPRGDGRDTIRIGGAILYDTSEVYYAERLTTNAPYGNALDLTNPGPLSNPWAGYPGGNPFPGTYPPSPNVAFPVGAAYSTIPMNLRQEADGNPINASGLPAIRGPFQIHNRLLSTFACAHFKTPASIRIESVEDPLRWRYCRMTGCRTRWTED